MLLPQRILVLALSIASSAAFKDTSPFLLFASTKWASDEPFSNVARADAIHSKLDTTLKSCEFDSYILVSQPSMSSADLSSEHWRERLGQILGRGEVWMEGVPEVAGEMDIGRIARQLELDCKTSIEDVDASSGYVPIGDDSKRVIKVSFAPLPSQAGERASKLIDNDSFLRAVLSGMRDQKYIVIYTTTPPSKRLEYSLYREPHLYDMDDPFPMVLHTDLKRDIDAHARNSSVDPDLPLFEKYQYFTPAIFMGILVSIMLFLILYAGVSAVASLQVSYFAFSKEMGPAAQKKQQQ